MDGEGWEGGETPYKWRGQTAVREGGCSCVRGVGNTPMQTFFILFFSLNSKQSKTTN